MTKESGNHQYVSYPMFKGLQKPLEFMGFQGRYITWAAATVGGGILSFIIVYCILGFIAGLIVLAATLCTGAALIFFRKIFLKGTVKHISIIEIYIKTRIYNMQGFINFLHRNFMSRFIIKYRSFFWLG